MKTVEDLKAYIERRYPVGAPTNTWRAVTGEPYVTIGSQHPDEGVPRIPGTVDEGKRAEWGFDEETACMQAAACFHNYAYEKTGILYWREEPMLDQDNGRYKVYMRLLVSDEATQTS